MRGHIRPARSAEGRAGRAWELVLDAGASGDGKRKQRWVRFHGTRREAEKELTRLLHQSDTTGLPSDGRQTVAQYLRAWVADYEKLRLSGQSGQAYRWAVDRLVEQLGAHRLEKVTPAQIQSAYRAFLDAGLSASSVRLLAAVLHRALEQALRLGLLSRNPADAVDRPSAPRGEARALTREQALALLKAAYADPDGLPVILALGLGTRLGETYALRWSDVDFDAGIVHVRRSLLPSREFKAPKSGKGRAVTMPGFVRVALREELARHEAVRQELGGGWNPEGLLCPSIRGGPRRPRATALMRRLCGKAGVPQVTFHALRHTCATLLLGEGEPVKVVSERLGHSTPAITLNVYAHILPGMQERAASKLDGLLGGA